VSARTVLQSYTLEYKRFSKTVNTYQDVIVGLNVETCKVYLNYHSWICWYQPCAIFII